MESPRETKNLDIYGSPPIDWDRVVQALDGAGDLAVERGRDAGSARRDAVATVTGTPSVVPDGDR